jgi:glutathione S-transferase
VSVDLFEGEQKSAPHLARHPFGVVPVLEDGDFVLFESRAIMRYLAGPAFVPVDRRLRARMDQWMSVDQAYVAPHTRALASERIVKKHAGRAPDASVMAASEDALGRAFRVLDAELGKTPYLAGDSISLADISLVPYVASTKMIEAERLLDGLPNLARWFETMRARDSVRAVLQ